MAITSLAQMAAIPVLVKAVDIPLVQETFYVRAMGGSAHDDYERLLISAEPVGPQQVRWLDHYRARFLSLCLCNAQGELLCTTPEDLAVLGAVDHRVLDALIDAAKALNGIQPEALEEAEKNLVSAQNGGSGSV